MFIRLCKQLGILRSLLVLATAIVSCLGPFVDGTVHLYDWRLLTSVIAPSVMLILVFVLPLDMTMSRIFMSGAEASERSRLGRVIRVEAGLLLFMVVAWLPFMTKILDVWPFD